MRLSKERCFVRELGQRFSRFYPLVFLLFFPLQDYDNAEELYKKAVALDPQHANNCNNFAYFMQHVKGMYQEAEAMYKQVSFSFRGHV